MINTLTGRPKGCDHARAASVRTTGLFREVCADCGMVSFIFESDLEGDVTRTRFAREADQLVYTRAN